MEVRESNTQYMVANTTNTRSPAFTVTGLQAGKRYSIMISSGNAKGRSEPVRISAFTSSAPVNQKNSRPDESPLTKMGEFKITPILGVLMTVGAALILVFIIIAAYFCVRRSPRNTQRRKRANDNRISYTETHIPHNKGIDDCIDGNNGGTALTPMLSEHERNPDIIPINGRGKKN